MEDRLDESGTDGQGGVGHGTGTLCRGAAVAVVQVRSAEELQQVWDRYALQRSWSSYGTGTLCRGAAAAMVQVRSAEELQWLWDWYALHTMQRSFAGKAGAMEPWDTEVHGLRVAEVPQQCTSSAENICRVVPGEEPTG